MQKLKKADANNVLAAAAMLGGSAFIAIADSVLKVTLTGASSFRVLWIRSLFVVIFIMILSTKVGLRKVLTSNFRLLHLLRVILGTTGTILFFESLQHLQLATAVILSFLTPLIMNAMAPFLLGETLQSVHVVSALIGFFGAAIIVWQAQEHAISLAGIAYGLASSIALSLAWTIVRRIGRRDHLLTFLFFLNIGSLTAGFAASFSSGIIPSFELTSAAAIMAALVLAGNMLMVKAYVMAPVVTVAPLIYSQLVWATMLQIAIWHEVPTLRTMIGAAFIVAAGLILTFTPNRAAS